MEMLCPYFSTTTSPLLSWVIYILNKQYSPSTAFSNSGQLCHCHKVISLKYELTLTRHIFFEDNHLQICRSLLFLIFRGDLKQTSRESGNETQVENASEPQQGNHSGVDVGLHPRAHGKLCATVVQDNTRRSDMSQAGSQSGCLPSSQRNLDPNHTPPYTVGQPLKWTVRHDRRASRKH